MIRSMTAYAKCEIKNEFGSIEWEIRSLNHRYLEIFFYLPEQFRYLDPILRKRVRSYLTRGKIECNLYFKPILNVQRKILLNEELVKNLIEAVDWIKMNGGKGKINLIDILKWPGVIIEKEQDLNAFTIEILTVFNSTLDNFILSREKEGLSLQLMIESRLECIRRELKKIRKNIPEIIKWQRQRLISKLEDAKIQLENNRLEQELLLISQKIDISEELDRLESHVKETYNVLKMKESVGRRLDFMMQEFNRESNTLISKSINTYVTNSAVELKVLIEQIREQVQNVE